LQYGMPDKPIGHGSKRGSRKRSRKSEESHQKLLFVWLPKKSGSDEGAPRQAVVGTRRSSM
jgi:hypothetical protein